MINLVSSTLIERPLKQVFDFVSTPENDFQWQSGTLATARLPKDRGAMQTFFRSIGHLMGRRNLSTFEITEFELNKKYEVKSLSGWPIAICRKNPPDCARIPMRSVMAPAILVVGLRLVCSM